MKIQFHRGLNQIGGCITEISTCSSRVFIDMGQNLPGCGVQTSEQEDHDMVRKLFDANRKKHEVVFYTHCHGDHIGLFHHVPENVPQYMGEGAKAIFKLKYEILLKGETLKEKHDEESIGRLNELIKKIDDIHTWEPPKPKHTVKPIVIGDIRITPFLCCHSVYDAYMFLIEAEGKRIWHTGDYRGHGYLGKGLFPVLNTYAKDIDLLITEGTMLGRPGEEVVHESVVSRRIAEQIDKYKYVFILASATDWERITAIKNAAKSRNRRLFVTGLFLQESIKLIMQREDPVWGKPFQKEPRILNEGIIANNRKNGFCAICGAKHLDRVMELRTGLDDSHTLLIYSSWDGYYKNPEQVILNPSYKELRDSFTNCIDIHTPGHASCETIAKVVRTVKPKVGVVCIHKEEGCSLESLEIGDVRVWEEEIVEL